MKTSTSVFLWGQAIAKGLSLSGRFNYLNALPALEIWKDDCSRQALLSILPQCLDGIETITSSQQKEVALELSICELENAGIEYPLDCNHQIRHRNIDKCIQFLEKSPQFWTSYSGNYRSVKEVCHQVSLPLKKEQIVEIYNNVTNLFQSVLNDLLESQADEKEVQTQLKKRFEAMLNLIDEIMEERKEAANSVNQTFNVFYENFELSLNNALIIIRESYHGVNTNLNEIERHIKYFTKELHNINELIRENQIQLKQQQEDLQKGNNILLNQQNLALERMKGINEYAMELRESTRGQFESMERELQFSAFKIQSINALINHNVDDLQVQRRAINQQTETILNQISEAFVLYLNASGQKVVVSFESSLNDSLVAIEKRLEQSVVSIELFESRVGNFISKANNATEYIMNVIPNFAYGVMSYASDKYLSMKMVFSRAYAIMMFLVVVVVFLVTKPMIHFIWKLLGKSFTVLFPLILGVVAAIFTVELIRVLSNV